MAIRDRWLAKVVLYVTLELGAMMGVPIRPEDIEAMSRSMNDAVVMESVRGEKERTGEPLPEDELIG